MLICVVLVENKINNSIASYFTTLDFRYTKAGYCTNSTDLSLRNLEYRHFHAGRNPECLEHAAHRAI